MKVLWICLSLLLLSVVACQKEDEQQKPFLAGVYDQSMSYKELNPANEIALKQDPILPVAYGEDSLDLDQDGRFDIVISQRNLADTIPSNISHTDIYPFFKLNVKNGVELATRKECYIIGHGQYSTAIWVDTVAYQTNVAAITDWSESNSILLMWVEPPTIFRPSNGPWYNLVNEERYIAIRKNSSLGYRYGWIKVKVFSRERLSFISYALENSKP